jgi:hypothetical protein
MLEAQAQSDASLQLSLYTSKVEQMLLFYELLGFVVVEDREYVFGRYLVMALHDNAGAQIRLASVDTESDRQRVGKQFFRVTSPTPFVPHKILAARGFQVSEYNPGRPTESFVAHDPEGNEVLVVEARAPRAVTT